MVVRDDAEGRIEYLPDYDLDLLKDKTHAIKLNALSERYKAEYQMNKAMMKFEKNITVDPLERSWSE